jgi:cytochrome c-type biogenesis protein
MQEISILSIISVFAAGLLSFLSPCVLPLIPGYISFISGENLSDLTISNKTHKKAIIGTIFFGIGFSTLFVVLGASATGIGKIFLQYKDIFSKIAGLIVIFFGLNILGFFKLNFLSKQFKWNYKKGNAPYYVEAFLLGLAFVFGWTPCIGPILASVLTFAANEQTVGSGILLLSIYSLGLWIPFLLSAIFLSTCINLIKKYGRISMAVEKIAGVLLIFLGILIMTNSLSYISVYLTY